MHKAGFCAAIKSSQKSLDNVDKISIRLQHSGDVLTVDEDDLENANPPTLDLVENICQLKYLNEASVLHCLRQRFASNLIHAKAGQHLIVVNPMALLSLYSEKVC